MKNTRCNRLNRRSLERLLAELHLDVAISLGAIVSVHRGQIPDSAIWQISRSLSELFRRQRQELRTGASRENDKPNIHPAVALLIAELRAARTNRKPQ